MKLFLIAALALGLSATGAEARRHAHHHVYETYGSESDFYTNVSGHRVHRPARASRRPVGATAHCGDGTWSFSEHRSGTCSHHGGIAG